MCAIYQINNQIDIYMKDFAKLAISNQTTDR